MMTETYINTETGKTWGYTATGELDCQDCHGTLTVTVPGHGEMENYDCEGPNAHRHNCPTCES